MLATSNKKLIIIIFILICIALLCFLVTKKMYGISLTYFNDKTTFEKRYGVKLADATNIKGYFINRSGGYAWVSFNTSNYDQFVIDNELKIKLTSDKNVIKHALLYNESIETMENSKVKRWIGSGFIPLYAYNDELKSFLIGKDNKDDSLLRIYICHFGYR